MSDKLLEVLVTNFGSLGLIIFIIIILEWKWKTISNVFGNKKHFDAILKALEKISSDLKDSMHILNQTIKGLLDFDDDFKKQIDPKVEIIEQTVANINVNVAKTVEMADNMRKTLSCELEEVKKMADKNLSLVFKKVIIMIGYKVKSFCIFKNTNIPKDYYNDDDKLKTEIYAIIKPAILERLEELIKAQRKLIEDESLEGSICDRIKDIAFNKDFFDYHFNKLLDNFFVKVNGDEKQIYRKEQGFKNIIRIYIEELFDKINREKIFNYKI